MILNVRTALAATVALLLAATAFTPGAGAIVPPRDCKIIKVGSRSWHIKADQIRCRSARRMAGRYLRTRNEPRYYNCRRGPRGSKLYRTCVAPRYSPDRTLYIFRR